MLNLFSILLKVAGGLGIFLLGMQHLSDGLQAVSGNRLRKMVAAATTNRFAGVATGVAATIVVQSSSIITVIVVGLVSTSLMTLTQAINVIIGSNIGTTATAWLIALVPCVGRMGLGIIAVSSAFYLFASKEKVRNIGLAFLGFGLIFFGLDLMQEGMKPIATHEEIKQWFAMLHADSLSGLVKCTIASSLLTAVIQSSAATTAISMTLAQQGIISFETAAASVLGMNIGTTATAWLASMGATTEAKRAALAHTLFNLIGVAIITPFFLPFIIPKIKMLFPLIAEPAIINGAPCYPHVSAPMAYIHTGFNLINTCIFLPFVTYFARLVGFLIPAKPGKEVPRLTVLDPRMISTPVIAVEQAAREVLFMADSDLDLLATFRRLLAGEENADLEEHILHREDILDSVQREITDFLGQIMTGRLPQEVANQARTLLRITDEYESVSDEAVSLLKMLRRLRNNKLVLSEQGRQELLRVHDQITQFGVDVTEAFKNNHADNTSQLIHMRSDSENIRALIRQIRNSHLSRLENNAANPFKIVICMDILNAYTRIKEDYLNIGETLTGEK